MGEFCPKDYRKEVPCKQHRLLQRQYCAREERQLVLGRLFKTACSNAPPRESCSTAAL